MYVELLTSFLRDIIIIMIQEDAYPNFKEVKAEVPQGSVLGPILYLLFTSDIRQIDNSSSLQLQMTLPR